MKFEYITPKVSCINSLTGFNYFLQYGQTKFCNFLINFLNLKEVRIQVNDINVLMKWLHVNSLDIAMEIPGCDDEICVVSKIKNNGELVAYFPYVLKGPFVKKYLSAKSFLIKLSEAISDQITVCYLQNFKGSEFLFGESLAKMIISNCISESKYDSIKFAHLIEKFDHLATSTFEGAFFPTGVIVSSDLSKYKKNFFNFRTMRNIASLDKREWFLANGQESFFLLDTSLNCSGIYIKSIPRSTNFVSEYFDEYYLTHDLVSPDFIVRTVGPNEISVSDTDGKEYIKIENIWRYRHRKNLAQFLVDHLQIEYKIAYAIMFYTLKCSRNHISSIIWMPNDFSEEAISSLTTDNRVRIWNDKLNILNESHQVLIEKILASDGAIVIEKNGQVLFESVFANMNNVTASKLQLAGSGETATQILASNGVAIKISQDGTIKIFMGNEKIYY